MILAVNELFGMTFQGEGPHLGKPCVFLRLAGCNLKCTWCDTPYSWDFKNWDRAAEVKMMEVDEVYDAITSLDDGRRHLVITGGEPMLQQDSLAVLTKRLHAEKWFTEIETAGTITPKTTELVKHWNISPKLEHSGNHRRDSIKENALHTLNLAPSRAFKFVIGKPEELAEVDELVELYGLKPVYIMPVGITEGELLGVTRTIAPHVVDRGYILTTRLHVLAFGNRRGV